MCAGARVYVGTSKLFLVQAKRTGVVVSPNSVLDNWTNLDGGQNRNVLPEANSMENTSSGSTFCFVLLVGVSNGTPPFFQSQKFQKVHDQSIQNELVLR